MGRWASDASWWDNPRWSDNDGHKIWSVKDTHGLSYSNINGCYDFRGEQINALQIGLGTFGTFIQNLTGARDEWDSCTGWLLDSCSEYKAGYFRGVAIECVEEHVKSLRSYMQQLPWVALVHAALGEHDESCEVYHLSPEKYEKLLSSVPADMRDQLKLRLEYLRNMSCVGEPHPQFRRMRQQIWDECWVDVELDVKQTEIISYQTLVESLNFCGVELLMVDAEGHDCAILRSMMRFCEKAEVRGEWHWPDCIGVETMGHCDGKEGRGAEAAVLKQLQKHGYWTLQSNYTNANMVHEKAYKRSQKLREWCASFRCADCQNGGSDLGIWPFYCGKSATKCVRCYSSTDWF
eukprot:TRINITY_DN6308_c0_g1_i7.p1 TRINITY_DN6308_c0_g1~~TRINITY_DN6308_c0_g1_i7.p1  ORF type:complete len:349 (-),score=48.31 TRINITY_DN6308_c0_g1_i7:222-1268(-)